jgi:predicted Rossmann-fold nucleotide-binding protein
VQTGKVTRFPVILFGTAYWSGLVAWLRESVVGSGNIVAADLDLVTVTDDVAEVVQIIVDADRSANEPQPPDQYSVDRQP